MDLNTVEFILLRTQTSECLFGLFQIKKKRFKCVKVHCLDCRTKIYQQRNRSHLSTFGFNHIIVTLLILKRELS